MREIQEQTGFAKSSIRESLRSHGYTLRPTRIGPNHHGSQSLPRRSPVLPYGYGWLDGRLVPDPSEYRVVQKILQLWQKGESSRSIANILNDQQIKSRSSKKWFHGLVISIVKRHQQRGESHDSK
ncbi:MAG: recombinase family protein [Bdellovibrionales bacterium]|nr:recombinase family protein [Bdellovibrionales bacterium]